MQTNELRRKQPRTWLPTRGALLSQPPPDPGQGRGKTDCTLAAPGPKLSPPAGSFTTAVTTAKFLRNKLDRACYRHSPRCENQTHIRSWPSPALPGRSCETPPCRAGPRGLAALGGGWLSLRLHLERGRLLPGWEEQGLRPDSRPRPTLGGSRRDAGSRGAKSRPRLWERNSLATAACPRELQGRGGSPTAGVQPRPAQKLALPRTSVPLHTSA